MPNAMASSLQKDFRNNYPNYKSYKSGCNDGYFGISANYCYDIYQKNDNPGWFPKINIFSGNNPKLWHWVDLRIQMDNYNSIEFIVKEPTKEILQGKMPLLKQIVPTFKVENNSGF